MLSRRPNLFFIALYFVMLLITSGKALAQAPSPTPGASSLFGPNRGMDSSTGTNTNSQNSLGTSWVERANTYVMGTTSMAMGGQKMAEKCGPCHATPPVASACFDCYVVGPGLIAAGGINIGRDIMNRDSQRGRITDQPPVDPNLCAQNPTLANCTEDPPPNPSPPPDFTGSTFDWDGDGIPDPSLFGPGNTFSPEGLPPDMVDLLSQAQALGNKYGVDFSDPKSVAALKAKAGGMGGDDGGAGGSGLGLSAADKEKMEKMMKKYADKFGVSGVGLEGGGGSGGAGGGKEAGLDLAALMAGLEGEKKPGSTNGLTRNLAGEPIGIASDDIFKMITKRYQKKIETNLFLREPLQTTKLK